MPQQVPLQMPMQQPYYGGSGPPSPYGSVPPSPHSAPYGSQQFGYGQAAPPPFTGQPGMQGQVQQDPYVDSLSQNSSRTHCLHILFPSINSPRQALIPSKPTIPNHLLDSPPRATHHRTTHSRARRRAICHHHRAIRHHHRAIHHHHRATHHRVTHRRATHRRVIHHRDIHKGTHHRTTHYRPLSKWAKSCRCTANLDR